jgi:hypothetical protein
MSRTLGLSGRIQRDVGKGLSRKVERVTVKVGEKKEKVG